MYPADVDPAPPGKRGKHQALDIQESSSSRSHIVLAHDADLQNDQKTGDMAAPNVDFTYPAAQFRTVLFNTQARLQKMFNKHMIQYHYLCSNPDVDHNIPSPAIEFLSDAFDKCCTFSDRIVDHGDNFYTSLREELEKHFIHSGQLQGDHTNPDNDLIDHSCMINTIDHSNHPTGHNNISDIGGSSTNENNTLLERILVHPGPFPKSPFHYSLNHMRPTYSDSLIAFHWLQSRPDQADDHSYWYVHNKPSRIDICGTMLRRQFIPGEPLYSNVCIGIIRLYQQLDMLMTQHIGAQRWRHFFPPYFAQKLWLERFQIQWTNDLRDMFLGDHLPYGVQHCQMLVAPVVSFTGTWSCYIWNLEKHRLHIIDPLLQFGEVQKVREKHEDIAVAIHSGML